MIHDIFGTEIQPNDYIAYAAQGRGSDHGTLRIGKVLEVTPVARWSGAEPQVKILRAANEVSWKPDSPLVAKKTTISRIDNIVVIHPDTVPAVYKELLATTPKVADVVEPGEFEDRY